MAFISILALAGSGLVLGLTVATVAGIVFAGGARRDGTDLHRTVLDSAAGSYVDAIRDSRTVGRYKARLLDAEPIGRCGKRLADADGHRVRRVSGGFVGSIALFGLLLSALNLLVVLFSIVAGGGLVLLDRAHRRKRDAEESGLIRRRDRELTLNLVDRRTVRLRIDSDEIIDQELSRLARASRFRPSDSELLSS